jgi:rhodanese-related sulfurtransferase
MIWPWVIAFALVLLIVAGWFWHEGRWDRRLFGSDTGRTCVNLRAREAKAFLDAHPETQVLDVRSAAEFRGGALPGARHISLGDSEFAEKAGALDRGSPVLVYCAGGYRSRKAVDVLKALGFADIRHLHRGWHSWRLAGLPVTAAKSNSSENQT